MPTNYHTFSATDFVCDEAFLHHTITPATVSERFWGPWKRQNPHQNQERRQGRQLLEAVQDGLSEYASNYLSQEDQARILATSQQSHSATPLRPLWQKIWAYRDIIYNADLVKDCPLTPSLTNEPLFQKRNVIVQAIDASHEVIEEQVVIAANGCPTY